jgi:hypothetical protein
MLRDDEARRAAKLIPFIWSQTTHVLESEFEIRMILMLAKLPTRIPRIVSRLLQLIGMAGAFWAAGTLT